MATIKITTYKGENVKPEVTISIPSKIFIIAKRLIPKKAYEALEEQGIDLNGIDELIRSGEGSGVLLEVEDHKKNEKIVISIEE
jgi:hypothetical protein